ncbi:MAG: hypothetical protein H0V66_08590 [Bdellovibrionales bacterium]|nr:hypothetical protein [Bdellovibrionales bacterium]
MKLMSLFFIGLLSLTVIPALGQSMGSGSSGGGGAYVCRSNGEITKSHLVDLWESENIDFPWPQLRKTKLNINYTASSWKTILNGALKNLDQIDPNLSNQVRIEIKEIIANIYLLPADVSITVPSDLLTNYFPRGCAPEGMMYYENDFQRVNINKEIFDKLATQTDIAASYLHEAIYKVLRDSKHKHFNSKGTRRLVACLFDKDCYSAKFSYPKDRIVYFCESESFEGYAYPIKATHSPLAIKDQVWRLAITRAGDFTPNFLAYKDYVMEPYATDGSFMGTYNRNLESQGWHESFNYSLLNLDIGLFVTAKNYSHWGLRLDLRGLELKQDGKNLKKSWEESRVNCNLVN